MRGYLTILALLILVAASCKKSNSDPKAPLISFIGMSPDVVFSGSSEDTVFISFRISDANGDLGNPKTHTSPDSFDVYMIDSRSLVDTSDVIVDTLMFYFPDIPKEAINPSKPTEGYCTIAIEAAKYLFSREDTLRARDTVRFDVFVKDKALNASNHFTTPNIYIER